MAEIKKRGRPVIFTKDEQKIKLQNYYKNKRNKYEKVGRPRLRDRNYYDTRDYGIVYKIIGLGSAKCYIGSTTHSLEYRVEQHENNYEYFLKGSYNYVSVFDIFKEFGMFDVEYVILETVNDITTLKEREGYYISNTLECINQRSEGSTGIKKRKNNIISEKTKTYQNAYYIKNRETRLIQCKVKCVCTLCNRIVNAEKLKRHLRSNICFKNRIVHEIEI